MLVQQREGGRLRLIAQHEHALVSGELAAAWRGEEGSEPLPSSVVLATSLHDLGWRELDRVPRWNAETGLPHDFTNFPLEEKYRGASGGIGRVAELQPYAGVLVSLHYVALVKEHAPPGFLEAEEERRRELLAALGTAAPEPEDIREDLAHLQLFDHLSLHLCLASPGSQPGSLPEWLSSGRFHAVDGRGPMSARWRADDRLGLEPDGFSGEEVALEVRYRELAGAPYASEGELLGAWEEAEEGIWRVRVGGVG